MLSYLHSFAFVNFGTVRLVCILPIDFPVSVTSPRYKEWRGKRSTTTQEFCSEKHKADCQGSGMFSKLCLHTLASWLSESCIFLHCLHSLKFNENCVKAWFTYLSPKLFQLYIYVFQRGIWNVNDCGLLKHNAQLVATLIYLKQLLAMHISYGEVYFFPCFVKFITQVRLDFANFNNLIRQWFSHERLVKMLKQLWNFIGLIKKKKDLVITNALFLL